jgi:hypothetical protein
VRIWIAKILIVTNGRGRSIVLHELTAGEAGLLVVLFPHLAGLDLVHVEDLGRRGADHGEDPDGAAGLPGLRGGLGAGA